MSLAIQHVQISRADFDALTTKDAYAIYFVIEADSTISLYTGEKSVSQDVRMAADLSSVTNPLAGKVYYDTTAKTCFIYNGTSFVYLMGDAYVFHYETMPTVTAADNGRTAIYTGATDADKGLIQGNAYKVINGAWAGITQESSNLQLAGLDYQGTTVLSKDSVASVGTADVAARADHSHALSTEVIEAIDAVAGLRTDVNSNTAAISINSTAISSNTAEIGSAKVAIASNTEVISSQGEAISSLGLSIASNTDLIGSNTEAIGLNTAAISTATQDIASNTQAISDLTGVVNANSTTFSEAIASNTEAISVNAEAISSNTKAIGDAEVLILSNTEAIAANTDAISVNTGAINTMSVSVSANTQSISDLTGVVNTNSTLFSEGIAGNTTAISDLTGVVNTNSTFFNEAIASNTDSIGVNATAIASLTQLCTWSIYTA